MRKHHFGIITIPISRSGLTPLSNLVDIVFSISDKVFLITGDYGYKFYKGDNRLKTLRIFHIYSTFFLFRIFNYILIQIHISFLIFKTRKEIDRYIFFIGGDTLALPMFVARILRKKTFILFAGSTIKTLESKNDRFSYVLKFLRFITCTYADKLIVYADCLIKDYSLERWNKKITTAYNHFIAFDRFKIKKDYLSREWIIGYIGRFDNEKGVLHLLHAVPEIVDKKPAIKFLFIGDGKYQNSIEHFILDNNLKGKIALPGWISHELIPDYLNQMKVLVIPSDTEGLPNVMIEAMSCGTPVLATPVGAIPSIIRDNETGFIMENNSPTCIAANVIRILNTPSIEKIAENARLYTRENFTFECAVTRIKEVIDED